MTDYMQTSLDIDAVLYCVLFHIRAARTTAAQFMQNVVSLMSHLSEPYKYTCNIDTEMQASVIIN